MIVRRPVVDASHFTTGDIDQLDEELPVLLEDCPFHFVFFELIIDYSDPLLLPELLLRAASDVLHVHDGGLAGVDLF